MAGIVRATKNIIILRAALVSVTGGAERHSIRNYIMLPTIKLFYYV